ncbi:MAG TPA: hypothetical protein VMV92_28470 [Streptosporangiaceae bacterium]|nr:hypothetical protein [Streptosporangiaceae bacterium]
MENLPAPHPRRARLTGSVRVPPGFEPALSLFTPRGERLWAEGWDPQFPALADDDSEPGTVFETTDGQQRATWVVCDREPGQSIRYARISYGQNAGTVTVTLDRSGAGTPDRGGAGRVATVSYDLTALSDEAAADLADFADHYQQYLRHWEQAIADAARGTG